MLHAVVMAGGGGTRFWPRSRERKPKQFLTLTGDRSLLQQTVERVESMVSPERTWIITGASYAEATAEQLPTLPKTQIVGEPMGRDTAPCIALAAALVSRDDADAVMIVTPADHVIEPAQEFRRAIQAAARVVDDHPECLATFGIRPTFPSTGYGYIERGDRLEERQGVQAYRVVKFREKPNLETAEQYVASGRYFWNAGIFCWKAKTILAELRKRQPDMVAAVERIAAAWGSEQGPNILAKEYPNLTRISIDFAVMEHATEVVMLDAPFVWDDVGSWLALERLHPQDAEHNTVLAEHVGIDTSHCVVAGEAGHLIATVGVDNLIIIQDGECILVADRRQEGDVKKIVDVLRQKGLRKYL